MRVDYDTQAYWKGCDERKLIIARCGHCARWIHPPKAICPVCWSAVINYEEVSGEARVYSFTETPQKNGQPAVTIWAQFEGRENVIILGALEPVLGTIAINDPLTLDWAPLEDTWVPVFRKRVRS
jgi:uncharacterized OB-fold protein